MVEKFDNKDVKNGNFNDQMRFRKKSILLMLFLTSFVAAPKCFYDLETTFFDREIVMEAMNAFTLSGINQSQWSLVYLDIMKERETIQRVVKEKASKMKPNPLSHPFQPESAEDLLLKTLYEAFAKVIRKHSNANEEIIQGMFKYIIERQSKRLEACFGKKVRNNHLEN